MVRQPVPAGENLWRMEGLPYWRRRLPSRRRHEIRRRFRSTADEGRSRSDRTEPGRAGRRGAYSTRGYVRARAGIERATSVAGRSMSMRSASTTSSRRKTTSAPGWGASSPIAPTISSMPSKPVALCTGGRYKLDFGGGASYVSPRVGSGTDSRYASTEDVFGAATTPGLGTQTDFIKVEASAAFDWRDNPSYPHSGGRYEVTAAQFDDRDLGQFDFYRVDVHFSTTSRWPAAIGCSPFGPSARSQRRTAVSPCLSTCSRRSGAIATCADFASRAFKTTTPCCSAPRPMASLVGARWSALRRRGYRRRFSTGLVAQHDGRVLRRRVPLSQQQRPGRTPGSRVQQGRIHSPPEVRTCLLKLLSSACRSSQQWPR